MRDDSSSCLRFGRKRKTVLAQRRCMREAIIGAKCFKARDPAVVRAFQPVADTLKPSVKRLAWTCNKLLKTRALASPSWLRHSGSLYGKAFTISIMWSRSHDGTPE